MRRCVGRINCSRLLLNTAELNLSLSLSLILTCLGTKTRTTLRLSHHMQPWRSTSPSRHRRRSRNRDRPHRTRTPRLLQRRPLRLRLRRFRRRLPPPQPRRKSIPTSPRLFLSWTRSSRRRCGSSCSHSRSWKMNQRVGVRVGMNGTGDLTCSSTGRRSSLTMRR